ncbi:uncharacterized protein G2W53_027692 [Senna tora]|uniref:Uncharacterized protein n=1 Tax=Senna tora TaxID=362788 RepID=A0A834THB4_9FABA|nr:uncharacterized protein G2W53_027692 [Senna tora]
MSQREGIVEDVNDESSAHHEAPPPPPSEGRGRGRSSGSNRGRGRPRGRGRTSRGGRAIEHLINDELVGNPMPQQNLASTQDVVLTGLQGVTRAVEALTSIIVDHVARTNTPAGEASRQVQGGPPGPQIPLVPQIPQERTTIKRMMPRRSESVGVKIDMVVQVQVDSQRVLRLILTRGSLSHPLDSRLRLMLAQIDRGRIHRTPNQALNKDRHNKNIISHLALLVGNFIVVYATGDQGLVIGVGRLVT